MASVVQNGSAGDGKSCALYIISKETDKGEMECCNCMPIKPANQTGVAANNNTHQAL